MKNMKLVSTIALATAIASVVTLQSCSKLASALNYDLTLQTASVNITIPPSAYTTAALSGSVNNYVNVDSFIKANTANVLGISNITSVKITSAVMTITNGSTANNFANFKSCYASVASNTNMTPYTINIDSNPDVYSTSLPLPVDSTKELKSYLSGNQFTYTGGGILRRAVTDSIKCTVSFKYSIHVQG